MQCNVGLRELSHSVVKDVLSIGIGAKPFAQSQICALIAQCNKQFSTSSYEPSYIIHPTSPTQPFLAN
jgi:hypothetical protein